MLKNALSAKAVASLKSGKHRDGEGLQFEVKGGMGTVQSTGVMAVKGSIVNIN